MDAQIITAITGALVALGALGMYFMRTTADKSVAEGVLRIDAKLDTLTDRIGTLQGALDVSREHLNGEVGKLDIRLGHLERRREALRPVNGGA